jgi:serine/threonine-protein kinase
MGSVFRGWDPRLQRPVALKTIRLAADDVPAGAASKLLAEAVAVASITHPNVVAVFDAEESAGAAFVAMELVDGIGLDKYLERRGQLDWREVVPLGAALAHGLAAAHSRELVHRDIKPGNVLLGHDGAIKIADFGLATFLSRLHDVPGKVFGTPGFLAPEALRGLPIDERSDLYAMGVVLFRALAGRYPVQGTTFQQLVASTLRDPTPRPEELERVPPEVAALVCELLDKDPGRRAAPASRVAERFDEIAQEHHLTWRLDFADTKAGASGGPGSLSASMPTMRLDADLA